jgi:hypothetical protein
MKMHFPRLLRTLLMSQSFSDKTPGQSSTSPSLSNLNRQPVANFSQDLKDLSPISSVLSAEENPENPQVSSLVHQPSSMETGNLTTLATTRLSQNAYLEEALPLLNESEQTWIDYFLTPWGMGSILLLLIANVLLGLTQLSDSRGLTTASQSSVISTTLAEREPELDLYNRLNLASEKSVDVELETLSTLPASVDTATPSQVTTAVNLAPAQVSLPPHPTIVVDGSKDLTAALLPPSLRPQLTQSYLPSVPIAPVASPIQSPQPSSLPPKASPIPPPPPINSTGINPSFGTVSSPANLSSNPTNTNPSAIEASTNNAINQATKGPENISIPSFSQRSRLKIQAISNHQDPNQLIEQLDQLQQQQQLSNPESNEPPTSNSQQ